jgi:hypothetical protein
MPRRRFIQSGLMTALGACSPGCTFTHKGNRDASVFSPGHAGKYLVYAWKGTHFEVGRQHGQALKNEIVAEAAPSLTALATAQATTEATVLDWVVSEYEPVYRNPVPSALEEVPGIAQGDGFRICGCSTQR